MTKYLFTNPKDLLLVKRIWIKHFFEDFLNWKGCEVGFTQKTARVALLENIFLLTEKYFSPLTILIVLMIVTVTVIVVKIKMMSVPPSRQ